MRPVLILAFACLLGATSGPAAHLKVFVLTGQSNSLGTTNGDEADPTPGTDPGDGLVRFYWHNLADPETSLGDSGGVFTSLQSQQGGYYPGSDTHWGPEMFFARTATRAGVENLAIIKASRGGGGNTLWSKSEGGHMYAHLTNTVRLATDALTASGHTFEIQGLLYLQGESDTAAEAQIADTRLATLAANLRADLPQATHLHVVVGGIAAPGTTRDLVRTRQRALAESDPRVDYFSTLDLQIHLDDGLHFDREAKRLIGERYAAAFFEAGILTRDFGRLVFVGDSITQGGNGRPSYRYEFFQRLVENKAQWTFVGSVSGAYSKVSGPTPDVDGRPFHNIHEGHWGWRAYWENGRTPLPSGRTSLNRGTGTIETWTGQSPVYALDSTNNLVAYQGGVYTQDTAVVLIGSNDLSDGSAGSWRNSTLLADVELMIQQYRAVQPATRFFLLSVPPVASSHPLAAWFNDSVTAYNTTLAATATAWSTATSPVYVIDASTGFDADTMTYDTIHPNAAGERHIANRLALGMGLLLPEAAPVEPPFTERSSSLFPTLFPAPSIHDGTQTLNSWDELNSGGTTKTLTDGILAIDHTGSGIASMLDGSALPAWAGIAASNWTLEVRLRIVAAPEGFILWCGTGSGRILIDLQEDRTASYTGQFEVFHNNADGAFHTFRLLHLASNQTYYLWRDDVELTGGGVPYDQLEAESRLLFGDFTGGSYGDGFHVEIEFIRLAPGNAFCPPKADTDGDGLSDGWEMQYYQGLTNGIAGDDIDLDGQSARQEFLAGTDPTDPASLFRITQARSVSPDTVAVSFNSSSQRIYRLLSAAAPAPGSDWTARSSSIPGSGSLLHLYDTDAGTPPRRFYKVEAQRPGIL